MELEQDRKELIMKKGDEITTSLFNFIKEYPLLDLKDHHDSAALLFYIGAMFVARMCVSIEALSTNSLSAEGALDWIINHSKAYLNILQSEMNEHHDKV
jgi:hypothetical protein